MYVFLSLGVAEVAQFDVLHVRLVLDEKQVYHELRLPVVRP